MELWNQVNLLPPPTFTFKVTKQDLDLGKLRNAIHDAINHFKDQGFLSRETALLSRIIYRMKMKFRSAKDFKSLEKVSHALDRYFKSNINSYLKLLVSLIPRNFHGNAYLPTKNMFLYVLVKLQGLAKLMERIHDSCKIAAYLTKKRMSIGHFWKLSVIVYALISRIYILVKFNCQFICDLYAKLYAYATHLQNPGAEWLPEGYELPSDLREWLGVQWVYEEEFVDLTNDTLPHILDFFDLCDADDDDDVAFCDEYVLIDEENELNDFRKLKQKKFEKSLLSISTIIPEKSPKDSKKQAQREQKKQTMRGFSADIDCGEIIRIDDSCTSNLENITSKSYEEFQQVDSGEAQDEVLDKNFLNCILSESDDNKHADMKAKTDPTKEKDSNSVVELIDSNLNHTANKRKRKHSIQGSSKFLIDGDDEDLQISANIKAKKMKKNGKRKDLEPITILDDSFNSTNNTLFTSKTLTNSNLETNISLQKDNFGDKQITPISKQKVENLENEVLEVIELSDSESKSDFDSPNKSKAKPNKSNNDRSLHINKKKTPLKSQTRKKSLSQNNDEEISLEKKVKKKKNVDNIVSSTPVRKNILPEDISFNLSTIVAKNNSGTNSSKHVKKIAKKKKKITSIVAQINSSSILSSSKYKTANKSIEKIRKRKRKNKSKNEDSISKSQISQINLSSISLSSKNKKGNKTLKKIRKPKSKNTSKGTDSINERQQNKKGKLTAVEKKMKRKGHFANKSKSRL